MSFRLNLEERFFSEGKERFRRIAVSWPAGWRDAESRVVHMWHSTQSQGLWKVTKPELAFYLELEQEPAFPQFFDGLLATGLIIPRAGELYEVTGNRAQIVAREAALAKAKKAAGARWKGGLIGVKRRNRKAKAPDAPSIPSSTAQSNPPGNAIQSSAEQPVGNPPPSEERAPAAPTPGEPALTVEALEEAIAKAVPGAQELSDSLATVFGGSGSDLRLGNARVPFAPLAVPAALKERLPHLEEQLRAAAEEVALAGGPANVPLGAQMPPVARAEGAPARPLIAVEGAPTPPLQNPPMVASLEALRTWQPPAVQHSASEVSANPVDSNGADQLPLIPVVEVVEKPRELSEGQKIARLIAVYVTAWQDRYSTDARPDVGKVARGILQRLLRDRTMEELALLIQAFCQMEVAWFETKRHDLATFEKNLNVVALALSKGEDGDAVDIEGIIRRQTQKRQALIAAGAVDELAAAITAGGSQ